MKQPMRIIALATLVTVTLGADSDSNDQISAVEKVLQMLGDMKAKGIKMKDEEELQFGKFTQWCANEDFEKKKQIKAGEEKMASLAADEEAALAEADNLAAEIKELEDNIAGLQSDKADAITTRNNETDAYNDLHKDYSESIYATEFGLKVLQKEMRYKDRNARALSLLGKSKLISKDVTQKVAAHLKSKDDPKDDDLDASLLDASAADSSLDGIVQMLKDMKQKFRDDRIAIELEEAKKAGAHGVWIKQNGISQDTATKSKSDKTQLKAAASSRAGEKKAALLDATQTKEADDKYLADTNAECKQKTDDFKVRQEVRVGEIEAIGKAMEIISGKEVTKIEDFKDSKRFKPKEKKEGALAALRATATPGASREHIANMLYGEATKLHSSLLTTAAEKVSKDPLKVVRDMLGTMITKIESELASAATENAWCVSEIDANRKTRSETTEQIEALTASRDEGDAKVAKLESEIAQMKKELDENAAALEEATKIREGEKADNAATVKDAQDAQTAVANAEKVLNDFYAYAAQNEALLSAKQTPVIGNDKVSSGFDKAYKGMGQKEGVMSMLDVIKADYAKIESDTNKLEADATKAHEEFSADSATMKAQLEKDTDHATKEKTNTAAQLVTTNNDLDIAQKELSSAEESFSSIKATCMPDGPTHEEREAKRREEIAAMKNALEMLNDEFMMTR
eukprot:TRINITY_DN94250_c0_g1_i1.p1 TRINITY_DN94250_c0_g1~~TRINITY_DN94250_c0_g1_i1.p1  ORF type:complete len:688 (-),score=249.43 TRINITY_DN94250_c0_g1_i1:58-2121(-)